MPLGRTVRAPGQPRSLELALPYRYRFQHVWVLGVTGAGKTSSAFKRWVSADALLDGSEGRPAMSSVVVDVKHPDILNSVAPVVLRRRRRLYVWAPFDEGGSTMSVNFLDYVPYPMDPQTAASLILSNMPDYARKDPFWRGVERQLLTLVIQLVVEEPAEAFTSPALETKVRHVLNLRPEDPLPPPRSMAFVLALSYLSVEEFLRLFDTWPAERAGKWRDRFGTLQSAEERTIVGGMLGIQQAMSVFAERPVILSTSYSSFRLETVAFQPTTLVIGLPTNPRPNRQVLTSLFLRQLLDVLGRIGEQRRPEGLPVPVTLYLDEIGTLGYIGNLPDYVATYRDIGVSFVLSTQDTQQLVSLFGQEQAEVLVANLHTRVVFGHDLRPEQAARISRDLGERVVAEPQAEYKGGLLSQRRSGTRLVYQVRPLMAPAELRSMPPFEAVVVLPGDRKARVYMEPVHRDPGMPRPLEKPLGWIELHRHNSLLDDLIGPAPYVEGIGAAGSMPRIPDAAVSGSHPEADLEETAEEAGGGVAGSGEPEPEDTGAEVPAQGAVEPAEMPADRHVPDGGGGGDIEEFFRALLDGTLRDERVPDGTPGFVYRSGGEETVLVPWGYFADWGRRTGRRFVELNASWAAEGLVGNRVTVMYGGRAVNCMSFTGKAREMLPGRILDEIMGTFREVQGDEIRVHGTALVRERRVGQDRAGVEPQPAAAGWQVGGGDRQLPFLRECIEYLRGHADRFEGHPARRSDVPVIGRWRHRARDGEELLLVRKDLIDRQITRLGGRPESVLAVWRSIGVLRAGEGDRFGYRMRGEGGRVEYVAFRWAALRSMGFSDDLRGTGGFAGLG